MGILPISLRPLALGPGGSAPATSASTGLVAEDLREQTGRSESSLRECSLMRHWSAEPRRAAAGDLPGVKPLLGLEQVQDRRVAYLVEGPFDFLAACGWDLPACAIGGTHFPPDR